MVFQLQKVGIFVGTCPKTVTNVTHFHTISLALSAKVVWKCVMFVIVFWHYKSSFARQLYTPRVCTSTSLRLTSRQIPELIFLKSMAALLVPFSNIGMMGWMIRLKHIIMFGNRSTTLPCFSERLTLGHSAYQFLWNMEDLREIYKNKHATAQICIFGEIKVHRLHPALHKK